MAAISLLASGARAASAAKRKPLNPSLEKG